MHDKSNKNAMLIIKNLRLTKHAIINQAKTKKENAHKVNISTFSLKFFYSSFYFDCRFPVQNLIYFMNFFLILNNQYILFE